MSPDPGPHQTSLTGTYYSKSEGVLLSSCNFLCFPCRREAHSYFFFFSTQYWNSNKQDGRKHILFTASKWTCTLITHGDAQNKLLRVQAVFVEELSVGGLSLAEAPFCSCAFAIQRQDKGQGTGQWGILFPWQLVCWGQEYAALPPPCHPGLVSGLTHSTGYTTHPCLWPCLLGRLNS